MKRSPPNCQEMLKWLLNTGEYDQFKDEELKNISIFKIISSACNMSLDEVVKIAQTLRIVRRSKN